MPTAPIKVLLVDISVKYWQEWAKALEEKVEFIHELTIETARESFAEHHDIAVIITIACMASDKPNTMDMVKGFREKFKGPMVAVSQYPKYRKKLRDAGCDHACPREDVVAKILELLKKKAK